jgi:vesicle-fusing ATPase
MFTDAYKSEQSLIVVDDIEDLIDYVAIGPRFSTVLLQTFRNFFKKVPPEGRRLVVLATTRNKRLMDQLGLSQHFRTHLHCPNINTVEEFRLLLHNNTTLLEEDRNRILEEVRRVAARGSAFSVPVKILQELLEVCAQDPEEPVLRFMDEFQQFVINLTSATQDDVIPNMEGL